MGVRGLTKYINDNAKLYLKPLELCDTYLVVDGSCVACHIFNWLSKSDSAFGGDYDEYYCTVQTFFKGLLKSNVTPIVIWDGGNEKKKLQTILSRARTKIDLLRPLTGGYSPAKFFPLFMRQTFCDVMEDLEIICIQSELEADIEIAAVAKALNCPVLSYDSDFFIYDVLYIPFSSVYRDPVKLEISENKFKYHVKCSVYDVNNFLNEFEGLDKSLLPIIAVLLGNDYIKSSLFEKFFYHVHFPKSKKISSTQRKIYGVLHWMKKESVESATQGILSHIESKKTGKVLKVINESIKDYTNFIVSPFVAKKINQLISENGKNGDLLKESISNTELPTVVKELYEKCRIHKLVMDIITLGTYYIPMQVEDLDKESTHLPSLDVIKVIFQLLKNYTKHKLNYVKIFLLTKKQYQATRLEYDSDNCSVLNLEQILEDSKEKRLSLLFNILNLSEEDVETVSGLSDSWLVFILTFIYWIKKLNNQVSYAHIHAVLLMSIVNCIVQKNVGFFRNNSTFMKKKAYFLDKLKDTDLSVVEGVEQNFSQLINNVTQFECLQIQQVMIPLRQTSESARGKKFSISTIHLFNCFQSCLFHIMQLNALFNYPLPHLKISDFYSGTVLFNIYLLVCSKSDVSQFGKDLFKNTPNIGKLYDYLAGLLCKYSTKGMSNIVKKNLKKRKKKKKVVENSSDVEEFVLQEEIISDECYHDENNMYSYLLAI